MGPRSLRGAGRADHHLATASRPTTSSAPWRPRRSRAGFEVAIVTGDKDFFQLVHDGIKVYNPRDDGTWFDADGGEGEVRRHAGAGRRRARPDGRFDRQHQGRARHRREGRARSDRHATATLEALLAHAGEVSNKRYREGLQQHAEDARQSRELARIRTDVPVDFDAGGAALSRRARQRCFEHFTRMGFRSLVMEYAPTADTVGKDYAVVGARRNARRSPTSCARAGRIGLRVLPDAPSAMRAGIVGLSFALAPRQRALRPASPASRQEGLFGAEDASPVTPASTRRGAGGLKPVLEDASILQGRARPEVRRDRAGAPRASRCAGSDDRHDARELPARRDAVVASARGSRARARRLQGAARGRRLRPRRQGDAVSRRSRCESALDYAGERADLALQLGETLRSAAREGAARRRCTRISSCRSSRCSSISSAPASASTGARCRRRPATSSRSSSTRSAQIFEMAGRGVQHQLAAAAVTHPVRQAAAADAQAEHQDEDGVDRRRSARGAGARARHAAPDPRVARACRS